MLLQSTFTRLPSVDRLIARVWLVVFGGGVIAHVTPLLQPLTTFITDALLFVTNGIVLCRVQQLSPSRERAYWLLGASLVTFFLEALGVATGHIFGDYSYGHTLLLQWFDVPLVIALNWAVLVLATSDFAARFTQHPVKGATASALIIVAFDLAMEPVAMALDYWQWKGGTVPVQNYLAWFAIAWALSWWLFHRGLTTNAPLLRIYFCVQLGFFLSLLAFLV